MATKKTDPKTWNLRELPPIPHLDERPYRARPKALHKSGSLINQLLLARPQVVTGALAEAIELLEEAEEMVRAACHQLSTGEASVPIARARNAMLTSVSTVRVLLGTLARSRSAALAAEATEVLALLFGVPRPALHRMPAYEASYAVELVLERIADLDGLRKRLEALVPAPLLAALRETHTALDEQMVAASTSGVAGVDVRGVRSHVHARITHYVHCVLATAKPGDVGAVQDALAALRPLEDLHLEYVRRSRAAAARTAKPRSPAGREGAPE